MRRIDLTDPITYMTGLLFTMIGGFAALVVGAMLWFIPNLINHWHESGYVQQCIDNGESWNDYNHVCEHNK